MPQMAQQRTPESVSPVRPLNLNLPAARSLLLIGTTEDKQKKLLQADSGHFSMIKMLHLADLITELNGLSLHLFAQLPQLEYKMRWS